MFQMIPKSTKCGSLTPLTFRLFSPRTEKVFSNPTLTRVAAKAPTLKFESCRVGMRTIRGLSAEVSGILESGNVWVFVQLIFGPNWPMN